MGSNGNRISPLEAKQLIEQNGTLLVAAYETGPGFEANKVEGAIPFDELKRRESELSPNSGLIFY